MAPLLPYSPSSHAPTKTPQPQPTERTWVPLVQWFSTLFCFTVEDDLHRTQSPPSFQEPATLVVRATLWWNGNSCQCFGTLTWCGLRICLWLGCGWSLSGGWWRSCSWGPLAPTHHHCPPLRPSQQIRLPVPAESQGRSASILLFRHRHIHPGSKWRLITHTSS